ncbi:MAG: sodium/proton-translocating pyrophosphatase [Ferruginibacter sp.]|nr:sodium/proton-translocating pyrophosphatase [Cytophagales bacterium]
MENLLNNVSFWGVAAVVATAARLVWEHVRGYVHSESLLQANHTARLRPSRSLRDTHYKPFTLGLLCAFVLVVLNGWMVPGITAVTCSTVLVGASLHTLAFVAGRILHQVRAEGVARPNVWKKGLAALEGKNPLNALSLLIGLAGLVFLFFYYQPTLGWTPYLVLNVLAAFILGKVLVHFFFLFFFNGDYSDVGQQPATSLLIGNDRMDTLSGSIAATALLGATFTNLGAFQTQFNGLGGVLLPFAIALSGVLVSGASGSVVRLVLPKETHQTLFAEKLATTLVMIVVAFVWTRAFLPPVWVFGSREYSALHVFYAAQIGLISGLVISRMIQWYESIEKLFLVYLDLKLYRISVLDKVIHNGVRLFSAAVPLVSLIALFLLAHEWVGLYGFGVAIAAMQSNLRTELAAEVAELEKLVLRSKRLLFADDKP